MQASSASAPFVLFVLWLGFGTSQDFSDATACETTGSSDLSNQGSGVSMLQVGSSPASWQHKVPRQEDHKSKKTQSRPSSRSQLVSAAAAAVIQRASGKTKEKEKANPTKVSRPWSSKDHRSRNRPISQLASAAAVRQRGSGQAKETSSRTKVEDTGKNSRGKNKRSNYAPDDEVSRQNWQMLLFGVSVVAPLLFLAFGNPVGAMVGKSPEDAELPADEKESFWKESRIGR